MHFTVQYEPTAKTLAKASLLFVEKKPFFRFAVGFINIMAAFLIFIILLKGITLGLTLQEGIALVGGSLWLFGRRSFVQWLLTRKMRHSPIVHKKITITLSLNGIIWSGKGLIPGQMAWDQIKYILEAQNGFLIPCPFQRFLWLPIQGFQTAEDLSAFRGLLQKKPIIHHTFPKWVC